MCIYPLEMTTRKVKQNIAKKPVNRLKSDNKSNKKIKGKQGAQGKI